MTDFLAVDLFTLVLTWLFAEARVFVECVFLTEFLAGALLTLLLAAFRFLGAADVFPFTNLYFFLPDFFGRLRNTCMVLLIIAFAAHCY